MRIKFWINIFQAMHARLELSKSSGSIDVI